MDLLLQLQAIVGVLVIVFFYNLWGGKAKRDSTGKEAPEPTGAWPVIGHLHLLDTRVPLARTLGAMADIYGPTFTLRLGLRRTLVVSSMEIAKECFTTNDLALASRPNSMLGKHMFYDHVGFGLAPYGPLWREIRKIVILELLSNRRLELLKHVRITEVDTGIKEIYRLWVKNNQNPIKVELKHWFKELSFNMMTKMISGKRYFGTSGSSDDEEARRIVKLLEDLQYLAGVVPLSDVIPYVKWIDFKGYERAIKRTAKELDSLLVSWIKEHRGKILSNGSKGEDFIDVMLSTLKDSPLSGPDNDTIIKGTSLVLLTAGTESPSITLTWAFSLLLNNPHVLKKAQDELDNQVGKTRNVNESDINNLVYLQAVVKETLRIYPPGPIGSPHMAREDCHISGIFIPAGTLVMVNLWKLQRDPRVWSEPEEFRPERFLTSHKDVDVKGQHYEYLPFGAGRRQCPGISFSLQAMHLTLARLLHGFELTTPSGGLVDMTESVSMVMPKASSLEVVFTPRLLKELYA